MDFNKRRGYVHQGRTISKQYAEQQAKRDLNLAQNRQAQAILEKEDTAAKQQTRTECFEGILETLKKANTPWGDFLEWISTPTSGHREERWRGFCMNGKQVERVLDLWAYRNTKTGMATVGNWAVKHVGREARDGRLEADALTRSGILQGSKTEVTEEFLEKLDMSDFLGGVREKCPTMAAVMREFSTTPRQRRQNARDDAEGKDRSARDKRKAIRIGMALIDLLGERSQNNSLLKHIIGLYLFASGASRQTITVLASLGICSSYAAIAGSSKTGTDAPPKAAANGKDKRLDDDSEDDPDLRARVPSDQAPVAASPKLPPGAGLLRRLSETARHAARFIARSTPFGAVYDNINMVFKVQEQIVGRKDAQENGTCATIFPLFNASPTDMKASDLLSSIHAAPPLNFSQVMLSPTELTSLRNSLVHTVLRELVNNCECFSKFRSRVLNSNPETDDQIPLHKTKPYTLPAMNIDESSIIGNAEVLDAIMKELGIDSDSDSFPTLVQLFFGDQLSVARARTILANRGGHERLAQSYGYAVFCPGLFHYQMALVNGIMETHFGETEGAGSRNPTSLSFFNTILNRKPIIPTSLPPYRTCRDLVFVSLTACVLTCFKLVSGCNSLEEYASQNTVDELRDDRAAEVAARLAAHEEAIRNGEKHEDNLGYDVYADALKQGDLLYENACLFLRDALIAREFTDAIKGGYSGRIVRVLKHLALAFRGCGRTKYAYELLHFIHSLEVVWPKPLRNIILKNWLVNPTGKENAWVPVDLMQEHMNFWTKIVFKAQGSNASWDWLSMITPCITLFRQLILQINSQQGARLGIKHHTPSIKRDLACLQDSMHAHEIFSHTPGRYLHGLKKPLVPDVVTTGTLTLNKPLTEYNTTFTQLQEQFRHGAVEDMRPDVPILVRARVNPVGIGLAFSRSTQGSSDDEEYFNDSDGEFESAAVAAAAAFDDASLADSEGSHSEPEEDVFGADQETMFDEEEEPSLDIEDYY
ncbi:uncharacterized protein BXZ73DRAFT_42703 [Epithele typhae]|uniref:uncharacterized protein n=1 Tax=Epithele typhae TaxID=378194 RepID=UPI002007EC40|nr:uncharacterized protein BXZ73DRAFT_42703 [Epithele typhae]KAH9940490.1 hypothetical protein BXZ73DRAFT_42703 [Epithele typhae]